MFRLPDTVTLALDTLEAAGYEAYAVGGCVRDLCRGVVPHDYDITTSATPDEIEAAFCGFRLIETGIKHGTVTVLIDGEPLEITTYRTDGEYLDRRHPSNVTFSRDIDDDLSRRDFTVNAMAYSPRRGLRDPFDGRGDLCRRVIRCVGDPDTRFSEDGLRIMRAVRFASCLGFDIDMATSESIHKNRRLLADISAERILSELRRLVVGENACRILTEYGDLIGEIMPEAADDGYTGRVRGIRDTEADEVLRLAVVLGGEDAVCALVRLKPDGKLLDGVGRALSLAKDGIGLDPISLRRVLRRDRGRGCGRRDIAAVCDARMRRMRDAASARDLGTRSDRARRAGGRGGRGNARTAARTRRGGKARKRKRRASRRRAIDKSRVGRGLGWFRLRESAVC